MSRLHRQKLRLRAMQREEGIIAPDAKEIDRDAIDTEGTTHSDHLELVDDDARASTTDEGAAPAKKKATTKRAAPRAKKKTKR